MSATNSKSDDIIESLINSDDSSATAAADTPQEATVDRWHDEGREAAPQSANDVVVHIANRTDPIVVLFGPTGCGKTMSLLRLTRYLGENGYDVKPRRDFRPDNDYGYQELCDSWDIVRKADYAALPTAQTNFMLLTVKRRGAADNRCLCQILEAPGELYFSTDPKAPVGASFPPYLETIKNCKNRKVWCIMLEPDWKSPDVRDRYVRRIERLKRYIKPSDTVLLVYNKIDLTDLVFGGTEVRLGALVAAVREDYPGLLDLFRNQNPITKWFRSYYCELLPFSTGSYANNTTGGQTFTPGADAYPAHLWNSIRKHVRGK